MRVLPVAYWERDVRILSPSIQTCSMGTRCKNPEYEVDGRTTIVIIIIIAIIHTEKFAVHNASVGLAQARPNKLVLFQFNPLTAVDANMRHENC